VSTRARPAVQDRTSRPVISRARAATSAPWPPRTALVTGASSGIGRVTALRLADLDTEILLVGRNGTALDEVAAATGGHRFATDLAVVGSENAVASRATEILGNVDLLICSAGVGAAGPFEGMSTTALRNLVAVNVLSPMMLIRAILPGMLERGEGRILLVGSVAGALGVRGEVAYSASKAALVGFADALRSEVAGRGVTVTLALPGAVDTPFFRRRGAPYVRRWPKPLPPGLVADRMLAAASRGDAEVWVPGWMSLAARVHGIAPPIYRRLANVFG